MSIGGEIKQVAAELARHLESRISHLQAELAEIEARKAEIEAQLKAARLDPERLLHFQPQIGTDFQCPRCWIEHEKRSALTPIKGRTKTEDYFRCHSCGFELVFPF